MDAKTKITRDIETALKEQIGDEVGVIKSGPLHDNPLRKRVSITLRNMDPAKTDSEWIDRQLTGNPEDKSLFAMQVRELGGTTTWLLRGVCEINVNLGTTKESHDDGAEFAGNMRDKVMSTVAKVSAGQRSDDGLWTVFHIEPVRLDEKESGGKGNWIWRYFLYWQAFAMFEPN